MFCFATLYLTTMMKIPLCTLFYIVNTLVHEIYFLVVVVVEEQCEMSFGRVEYPEGTQSPIKCGEIVCPSVRPPPLLPPLPGSTEAGCLS